MRGAGRFAFGQADPGIDPKRSGDEIGKILTDGTARNAADDLTGDPAMGEGMIGIARTERPKGLLLRQCRGHAVPIDNVVFGEVEAGGREAGAMSEGITNGDRAFAGGGKERIEKQHKQGKLTARERIDILLDPGSFVEVDRLRVHRSLDFGMDKSHPAGDGMANLKKAKIALVTRRAELRKAEQDGTEEAELALLRKALAEAERQLHAAEDASGKPAPDLQRIDKRPVDAATRALKTELAYARADFRRLEREGADPARLAAARERLAAAESALAERDTE